MTAGIYSIHNRKTGCQYIGSSKNIETRWRNHKGDLRRGTHSCIYLQRAWNKYGAEAFDFVILETSLDYKTRIEREDYFLKITEFLYNTQTTAFVTPPSAEDKIGKALRGRKRSPDATARSAAGNTGKKRSAEVCANMSAQRKGKPLSEAHKEALKGSREWDDESRENMSQKQKANWERRKAEGFKWSDDVVQKRNEAIRKAKQANPWKPPPEFGKKVSEGQKRRQERERQLRNNTGIPDARQL